jgi:hypothetical protein
LEKEFGEDIIEIPQECLVHGDIIDELYTTNMNVEEIKNICIFSMLPMANVTELEL